MCIYIYSFEHAGEYDGWENAIAVTNLRKLGHVHVLTLKVGIVLLGMEASTMVSIEQLFRGLEA